ncbi:MAG: hypothetical protein NVS3B25_32650 [Hymenobacter sp.]
MSRYRFIEAHCGQYPVRLLCQVYSPREWWCIFRFGISHTAMGQLLHGSARTTQAVRGAIQRSPESLQALAARHGINPKTVAKWRTRPTVQDARRGPAPASTVLPAEEEASAVAFRRHTLLPLDDWLYALQATMPRLSRSALPRCFQRHGVSRWPLNEDGQGPPKKRFKDYPIGYLPVDFAEGPTEEGRQYLPNA